ncbi:MAG: hypothetical protein GY707_07510 [Desulfobacteraceae bacterium]|nr:hypothetical protein [Desulfobacteraceae bacterium]
MEMWVKSMRLMLSGILILLLTVLSGCVDKTPQADVDLPEVSTTIEGISDIELPADMKWKNKDSMVIKTESFKGGVLTYSGRVEINSLKDFIISSMMKNKWKHVGEASYKNMLLAFTKPNKTCLVTLTEGFGGSLGKTHATLYVTVDLAAAKKLNPFGEPMK